MIKAFVCDTRALTEAGAEKMINKTPALAGVITPRSSVRWLESAAGYILLVRALGHLGYTEISQIVKDERGKPHLLSAGDEAVHFSISHRMGVALVAISDSCECGADIEKELDAERASRIEDRYLSKIHPVSDRECKCDMFAAVMDADGNVKIGAELAKNDYKYLHIEEKRSPNSATERWTLLEAMMKLDGCGVSGLARFDEICANAAAAHFSLWLDGERYSVTVAECVNI